MCVSRTDRLDRQALGLRLPPEEGEEEGEGLDQRSCVRQVLVRVQAGEETHVAVFVRLQRHHGLLQLVAGGTAGLLEVRCTDKTIELKKDL